MFDKITKRLRWVRCQKRSEDGRLLTELACHACRVRSLCDGLDLRYVDPGLVAQKVVLGMYNGVSPIPTVETSCRVSCFLGQPGQESR
jgi:hypothetical protein